MDYPWKNVPFKENLAEINRNSFGSRQAAHALLFSSCEKPLLFNSIPMRYAVLMQLRHDGMLGFPGGFIDEDVSIETGLNRELKEEINLDKQFYLKKSDYHGTWIHEYSSWTLIDHFYVKRCTEIEYLNIEKAALKSMEWGQETLGILRVPLYDLQALANFFQHKFIGNARDQLVQVLIKNGIFSADDINQAWALSKQQKD